MYITRLDSGNKLIMFGKAVAKICAPPLCLILLLSSLLALFFISVLEPYHSAARDTSYGPLRVKALAQQNGSSRPSTPPDRCSSRNCNTSEQDVVATKMEQLPANIETRMESPGVEVDIERSIPPLAELYRRLAIVTAISSNHYEEALPWIASIQTHMPEKTIIVYDIGLDSDKLAKAKKLCNVEVRPFQFSSYPPHVQKLLLYAWKPIIIDITLREFGVIFWGDASIRLRASLKNLLPIALKHHGYMTHFHAFDPKKKEEIRHNYYFTDPGAFTKLGVNRTEYYLSNDAAPHAAANRQLFINGSVLQEMIVQPLVQCALEYRCISPEGAHYGEHRYDASTVALLIYKNLPGEWTRQNNDNRFFDEVVELKRDTQGKEKVKMCP